MSDYKYHNSTVEGSSWKRTSSILVYNELGEVPRVAFGEQVVVDVGGEVFTRDVGTLNVLIDEEVATETFQVLNAEGEETGTEMSVGQLAAMIASAYVHFADKRDREDKEALEDGVVETDDQIPGDIPGDPDDPKSGDV